MPALLPVPALIVVQRLARVCAVYVVFGATGGIGSCLSQRLARHPGAALVVVSRDAGRLETLGSSLQTQPANGLTTVVADVTNAEQVRTRMSGPGTPSRGPYAVSHVQQMMHSKQVKQRAAALSRTSAPSPKSRRPAHSVPTG